MKCTGVAAFPAAVSLNSATKMKNSNGVTRPVQSLELSNVTLGRDLVSFKGNPVKLFADLSADGFQKLVKADKNVGAIDDAITRGIDVIKKHAVKERAQFTEAMEELVSRRKQLVTCIAADDAFKQAKKIAPDSKDLKILEGELNYYKAVSEMVDNVIGEDGLTVSPGIYRSSIDVLKHVEANGATKYMDAFNSVNDEAASRAFKVFDAK